MSEPDGRTRASHRRSSIAIAALALIVAACGPGEPFDPDPDGRLEIEVTAGPTCPVEREPPDPECAPRPVMGAPIVVRADDGSEDEVARATTSGEGRAILHLPAGDYLVIGEDVEGLMGQPEPARVTIVAGRAVELLLEYDTGIR